MEKVLYIVFGNHPKANTIKERALRILRFLKARKDWVELSEIEKELGIDRNDKPSMFYKPLSALKRWKLLDSKRRVTGGRGKHVKYTTYYKFTPERFISYLRETLPEVCKTELRMFN